jgi:hypothetical protein
MRGKRLTGNEARAVRGSWRRPACALAAPIMLVLVAAFGARSAVAHAGTRAVRGGARAGAARDIERLPRVVRPRVPVQATLGPILSNLRVGNGTGRFAGDTKLLTTISPNGDGYRDQAIVRFTVDRWARITLYAWSVRIGLQRIVGERVATCNAGPCEVVWSPPSSIEPASYILRIRATGASGHTSVYGWNEPYFTGYPRGPVVHVQGIDANTGHQEYRPGQIASIQIRTDAKALSMDILHVGPETSPGILQYDADHLYGVPVIATRQYDWTANRTREHTIYFRVGAWQTGIYAVRLTSPDGRYGFAPFVVLPAGPDGNRIAVIVPTNTWQAYNFRDTSGDGWPDTWYANPGQHTVGLTRPYLFHGVPANYHDYEAAFIRWIYRHGYHPDFLSDYALGELADPARLAARYRALVFFGHEEYVTSHVFDLIQAYRDDGGNLAFLSADNLYREVDRTGSTLRLIGLYRDFGHPEAAIAGVQYIGCCNGVFRPYTVTDRAAAPWLFTGTGLVDGSRFGHGGIEADQRSPASPRGTARLAWIPDLIGPGMSAEMTRYTTAQGARVFAAGTLNFAGTVANPIADQLMLHTWEWLRHG